MWLDILSESASTGYRPGEGVDADRWPTPSVCAEVARLTEELAFEERRTTAFTQYARGEAGYTEYTDALRAQLEQQGGGWVTVAPRDTAQQGNDSESAGVNAVSRQNAEVALGSHGSSVKLQCAGVGRTCRMCWI